MAELLIADDNPGIRDVLQQFFRMEGHAVHLAGNVAEALEAASTRPIDAVFLDVHMPDGSGLDIIGPLKESPGKPEIIILTGHSSPDGAEMAITSGAWDYLQKPPTLEQLRLVLHRALEYRAQKTGGIPLKVLNRQGIVGESPALLRCLEAVAAAAQSDASVLVIGETGVGKELVSQAIHYNSARREGSFVVVDCAALPGNLVESILFGHEKGAFTGATARGKGLLAGAHGGTLFLDEVGELPAATQKGLLRALQEKRFRPVGSNKEEQSDFRVVAATNRDLDVMVQDGHFRGDLLFRLKAIKITVPPLRERLEDIKALTVQFTDDLCRRYNLPSKGFSPDFFEALRAYDWPGNVRELMNTVEWLLARALNDPTLYTYHLPPHIRAKLVSQRLEDAGKAGEASEEDLVEQTASPQPNLVTLKEYRSLAAGLAERTYLKKLLSMEGMDPAKAQSLSGLSKSRFYALLQKHGLTA